MFANMLLVSSLLWGQAINIPPRFGEPAETAPSPARTTTPDASRPSAPPIASDRPTFDAPRPAAKPDDRPASDSPQPAAKPDDRPPLDFKSPKDLLADCLAARSGSPISGKGVDLAAALAGVQEGKTRFEVVAAYWRLVRQFGESQLAFDYDQQIRALRAAPQATAQLKTAQAASEAALHEAELAVLAAQQELVGMIQWSAAATLPLPTDRPHVGAYRTQIDEVFAGRSVPVRARRLDQTLPLRRQVMEARAAAAGAAQEAWALAVTDYRSGQADLARLLDALNELRLQRAAFLAAACQYNQQIADYVLNVVAPSSSTADIVAMLIKTSRQPAAGEEKKEERKSGAAGASGAPSSASQPRPDTFGAPSGAATDANGAPSRRTFAPDDRPRRRE